MNERIRHGAATSMRPPLWQHPALARYEGGTAALNRFIAEHTIELAPGQYVLVGTAARLRARIDQRLAELAASVGAEVWHLPSVEKSSDCIPATAHNVYRALRGTRLPQGRTITALGTASRQELFGFQTLLRQGEFSMREVVLVGSAAYVLEQRARLLVATQMLVRDLDVDADLEVATGQLLASDSAGKYHALHAAQLDLLLRLDASTRTAATSFHLDGTQFAAPMEISVAGGAPVETACVGWDIERWMAAVVARWDTAA